MAAKWFSYTADWIGGVVESITSTPELIFHRTISLQLQALDLNNNIEIGTFQRGMRSRYKGLELLNRVVIT
jgi:hypothetical protein